MTMSLFQESQLVTVTKVQGRVSGQSPACDDCLTVWWPGDRSCSSVSLLQLWTTCAVSVPSWCCLGAYGLWWSSLPSCGTGCCKCPGGQAVCPRWCSRGKSNTPCILERAFQHPFSCELSCLHAWRMWLKDCSDFIRWLMVTFELSLLVLYCDFING